MTIKLANNVSGFLNTAITASDTGIVLQSGNGANFPSLSAGEYFYATLVSTGGTLEVVKVTARSGDSMTVVRAQDNSSAASFAAGSRLEMRINAAAVREAIGDVTASQVGFTPVGGIAATDVQAALAEVDSEKIAFTRLDDSDGSSLMGFLQAGTGAQARTVQSKLRDVVSVFDFMTSAQIADVQAGNLTQNVTSALQACIAALTRGQTMYFPKGAYLVTSTLTINKSINIVGESKFDSIIYGSGFVADASILDFTGTTGARIQDLRMENISIWSSNNLARGMTLTWVNKSSFSNLYFYNLYRGVYGDNAWSNNWKNVSAYSITTELFNYGPECNNNHFDRVEFRGATGIKITGNTAGIKFTACDFEGITDVNGAGCYLAPVTTKSISGVVFDGCYFENIKGTGIYCNGVDANSVVGLVVQGCYFFGGRTLIFGTAGTAVTALVLTNVSGFRIAENMFLDWQDRAIFRDGTEVNGVVENNVLSITPTLTNSSNLMSSSVAVRNNTYGRKEQFSLSAPASGSYTQGDFVWNLQPSLDANSMAVLGWARLTTGSGHVIGTDWARAYVSNLSPAV